MTPHVVLQFHKVIQIEQGDKSIKKDNKTLKFQHVVCKKPNKVLGRLMHLKNKETYRSWAFHQSAYCNTAQYLVRFGCHLTSQS